MHASCNLFIQIYPNEVSQSRAHCVTVCVCVRVCLVGELCAGPITLSLAKDTDNWLIILIMSMGKGYFRYIKPFSQERREEGLGI